MAVEQLERGDAGQRDHSNAEPPAAAHPRQRDQEGGGGEHGRRHPQGERVARGAEPVADAGSRAADGRRCAEQRVGDVAQRQVGVDPGEGLVERRHRPAEVPPAQHDADDGGRRQGALLGPSRRGGAEGGGGRGHRLHGTGGVRAAVRGTAPGPRATISCRPALIRPGRAHRQPATEESTHACRTPSDRRSRLSSSAGPPRSPWPRSAARRRPVPHGRPGRARPGRRRGPGGRAPGPGRRGRHRRVRRPRHRVARARSSARCSTATATSTSCSSRSACSGDQAASTPTPPPPPSGRAPTTSVRCRPAWPSPTGCATRATARSSCCRRSPAERARAVQLRLRLHQGRPRRVRPGPRRCAGRLRGVRVMVVRPGLRAHPDDRGHGRRSRSPPPPTCVAAEITGARAGQRHVVWAPPIVRWMFAVLRHLPRPLWRDRVRPLTMETEVGAASGPPEARSELDPRVRPAMRPRQWAKNVLVFAAPIAAGSIDEWPVCARQPFAFVAFCLAASGTYLLNDARDVESDRLHPMKRNRPIAVAEYATVAVTSGVMINGIIKIGFSTIGNPKITGSLILKIPGTIQVLDNAFEYFDRPNTIIANTSPNVAPEPPIHINHWYNGSGDMNGN